MSSKRLRKITYSIHATSIPLDKNPNCFQGDFHYFLRVYQIRTFSHLTSYNSVWGNMTLTCSSTSWHLPLETTTNQSQSFASTTVTPSTIIFHSKSKNLLPLVVSFVGLSHPRQQKMKVKIEPCSRHLFLVVVQGVPASFGLILSKKVEFWNCFAFEAPLEIHDTNDK